MASTREQLRSEISFRDEVIRVSCLKGRTAKLNELSPFMDGMAYALAGSHRPRIVSALIHGITERPKSREMPSMRECPRLGTRRTARPRPGDVGGRCVAP